MSKFVYLSIFHSFIEIQKMLPRLFALLCNDQKTVITYTKTILIIFDTFFITHFSSCDPLINFTVTVTIHPVDSIPYIHLCVLLSLS